MTRILGDADIRRLDEHALTKCDHKIQYGHTKIKRSKPELIRLSFSHEYRKRYQKGRLIVWTFVSTKYRFVRDRRTDGLMLPVTKSRSSITERDKNQNLKSVRPNERRKRTCIDLWIKWNTWTAFDTEFNHPTTITVGSRMPSSHPVYTIWQRLSCWIYENLSGLSRAHWATLWSSACPLLSLTARMTSAFPLVAMLLKMLRVGRIYVMWQALRRIWKLP